MTADSQLRPLRQKVIGILGGCSDVATGEYYKFLNEIANETLGNWDIAETIIVGMNFGNVEAFVRQEDWDALTAYMDQKIQNIVAAGADILICGSNTLHRYLGPLAKKHGIDLIHIADPTGEAIQAQNLKRLALFGTRPVMEKPYLKDYYSQNFNLEIITPNEREMADIDQIIFDELVKFKTTDASRKRFLDIAARLATEQGAEGLILGCTEIFLLLRQADCPNLLLFNTARLHCEAAVKRALG